MDKTALGQENARLQTEIKNLLEELKLTKDAAGDSGSQIGELNRRLKVAQENSDRFENELRETKHTLETRTNNFLKEKAEMRL